MDHPKKRPLTVLLTFSDGTHLELEGSAAEVVAFVAAINDEVNTAQHGYRLEFHAGPGPGEIDPKFQRNYPRIKRAE